jgi:two-component system, NarL family, response regulator LiaR
VDQGRIRVLVVSAQDIVDRGLVAMLASHPATIEILRAETAAGVTGQVDVVVYDVLGLLDRGPEELRGLIDLSKGVIALGRDLRPDLAARAIRHGAVTTVSIGATADVLVAAIQAVYRGETDFMDAEPEWLAQAEGLSEREAQVLGLIARGLTNQAIADELFLSVNSVKTYIRSGYRKIGVARRSQAVGWAMNHGFTSRAGLPERRS